ncbi:MAG TPA: arsinothricin resistance N-acetyltransferase ArsN1 family B [Gammaproteobacteria bacterium]|nr:arsinothricin resistance N-acetyltransferase ArsN1 family B [Gammaproteobacteria bacterium]
MDIRLASTVDAPQIADIYRPYVEDTVVSFESDAPSEAEMAQRIAGVLERAPWLVMEEQGRIVAYAYACSHRDRAAYRWSVDTSVYVRAGHHRCGLGRALYTELLTRLVQFGYYTAYAGISLPNAASVGLHESFGFEPVGIYKKAGYKFGAWHDVGWWQRPLRSYTVSPELPRHQAQHA